MSICVNAFFIIGYDSQVNPFSAGLLKQSQKRKNAKKCKKSFDIAQRLNKHSYSN